MPTRLLLATLGSALFAALFLVGEPAGAGLAAVGVAVVAIAVVATRRREPWRIACWAAAAALALVPAVRAAEWVVVLSLLAAVPLASLAATGARTWREVLAGELAWIAHFVPGLAGTTRLAARLGGESRLARFGPGARGAVLAALLLAIFVPLFVTADAAFAELVDSTFAWDLTVDRVGDRVAVFLLLAGLPGALILASLPRSRRAGAALPRLGRTEWLIALVALDALFAAFVALQLATLFGGHRHVLDTAGLTYAEYAHQGFGQLMVVGALTLAVIALARRDSRGLRLLLGLLCALTLVVLASALKRLGLYEEAFGFTRLRLLAHGAILWLGGLFVLIVAAGALRRGAWLPRATVALSAVAALGFVIANPDARIAAHNVERYEATGKLDRAYLEDLSPDAASELARVGIVRPPPPGGFLSWNLAR